MAIRDYVVAHDANIAEHKLAIGGRATGAQKFYVGTDGTQAYELAITRVPDANTFTSIDAANNACVASRGDIIYVLPGHTESLTTAGAITLDTIGVQVIGIGEGNLRPQITFASTDNSASIIFSAAGVSMVNVIGICGDDGLTNPFHLKAADLTLDIEWRDGSATVEAAAAILTTAAALRLDIKLKYIGFAAGNACVNAIRLVGCTDSVIDIDFYGVASTSIIEFHTTLCSNILITGKFYNEGTSLTKNVVDTATSSIWSCSGWDGHGSTSFSGGDNAALAADDTATIAGLVGAINDATTDSLHGKIGTDTEMADSSLYDLLGVELKTDSLAAILYGAAGMASWPTAAAPGNAVSLAEAIRDIWDGLRNGTGGAEPATNKSLMDYVGVSPAFHSPGLGYVVTKDCDLGAANDDLFTVTGKVLITLVVGEVTTTLSGAEAFQLRIKTDNIALCAATTIDTDADGTQYIVTGDFGDAMNGGGAMGLRAADVNSLGASRHFVMGDAGGTATIESNTTGNNGNILFTLCYIPLEAGAGIVTAA